ncbi:MAG: hypothetical protein VB980_06990, partial [Opitutales bacterium]
KLGGDVVAMDDDDFPESALDFTEGNAPKLAFNSVGGGSALRLAKSLCGGGVHVTFGAMVGDLVRFPTRRLIFDDVRFVGFWLDQWRRKQPAGKYVEACEEILFLAATNVIQSRIEKTYSLGEHEQALRHAGESRFGKVLFVAGGKDEAASPQVT